MCEEVMEKTEFKIAELSEAAKQAAYEAWNSKDNLSDFEWWDWLYEEWTEKLEGLGISNPSFQSSGFCSQGDGACFTGRVRAADFLRAHYETHPEWKVKYHMLELASDSCWAGNFNITHSGHYYHSNSVQANDLEWCTDTPPHSIYSEMDPDEFCAKVDALADVFETEAMLVCRQYMNEIYKELNQEYDRLRSMESFIDACGLNEWLFDEEGEQI